MFNGGDCFLRQTLRNKKAVFENLLKLCHENIENLNYNFCSCKTPTTEFSSESMENNKK